ncbi:MAG: hypothetical protein KGI06_04040 [Candidatus Micrarchaeota archaeon]|nr:hypothetical protein [Candidatus Micrarchaeota archaeon]
MEKEVQKGIGNSGKEELRLTLRKRALQKLGLGTADRFEGREGNRELIYYMDGLRSEGIISSGAKRKTVKALDNYNDIPHAMYGVSYAIYRMAKEMEEHHRLKIKDIGFRRNAMEGTFRNLSDIFSDKDFVEMVKTSANAIRKATGSEELISRNVFSMVYDGNYRNSSFHGKDGIFMSPRYGKDEVVGCAEVIMMGYKRREEFDSFFEKYTGSRPEARIIALKEEKYGHYLPIKDEVFISAATFNSVSTATTIVHELTHSLQYRKLNAPYLTYSEDGKNETGTNAEGEGVYKNYGIISSTIAEGSACFFQEVYSASRLGKEYLNKDFLLKSLDVYANSFFHHKEGESRASMEKLGGWIENIYGALGDRSKNPADSLYNAMAKDYDRDKSNKYGMGIAIPALLYAANGFDLNRTTKELIDAQPYHILVEKLAHEVKNDTDGKIIGSLKEIIR